MTKRISLRQLLRENPSLRVGYNLHNRLKRMVKALPQDYDPWGQNIRWADDSRAYPDCSGGCRFALWLEAMPSDWLVCSNPKSHRYGLLTFEHQGCEQFKAESARAAPAGSDR